MRVGILRRAIVLAVPLLAFLGLLSACSPSSPSASPTVAISPSVTSQAEIVWPGTEEFRSETSTWTPYWSERYGFAPLGGRMAHPPDWTLAADAGQSLSTGCL